MNRSGAEYACVQGNGIFEGPVDGEAIDAIVAWGANVVRVPLNETCWLGINRVPAAYSGEPYRSAVVRFVENLHRKGIYAILDLHWSAAGIAQANKQAPMPDKDHAPAFWRSVATTFKNDPATLFDLFNEPDLRGVGDPWACWRDGCTLHDSDDPTLFWEAAGMQSLVDAVRETGARQPILAGGLAFANDMSGWLAHPLIDPAHALVASFHVYNFNVCTSAECWSAQVLPVARVVPVITGELGEDDCAHGFADRYMHWADAAGISYLGWTWNDWGAPSETRCGPKIVLIADYSGRPTPYGIGLRNHLLSLK